MDNIAKFVMKRYEEFKALKAELALEVFDAGVAGRLAGRGIEWERPDNGALTGGG